MIAGYKIRHDLGGVIEQVDKDHTVIYNKQYIENNYETYKDLCDKMSYLRIGWILGSNASGKKQNILDIGYGNGSFLNIAKEHYANISGCDINGFDISYIGNINLYNEIPLDKHFDTVTFYDSLEHFKDPTIIKNIDTEYIIISIPHLNHEIDAASFDTYFTTWKHRKPNEHLWHWNKTTLNNFMNLMGYYFINGDCVEDCIRKSNDNKPNIWTATFKKDI